MQSSIEKFLFFTLLGIILFSCPDYLFAAETPDDSLLINQPVGELKDKQTYPVPSTPYTTSSVTLKSQGELYEVVGGTIMTIIGLVAVAVALFRWKANDLSLISFGVFCFIYGARSSAFQYLLGGPHLFWAYWRWFLTYLTPVPIYIFFEQFVGKGWKSSIRRIWQIQFIFVIAAASVALILRSPSAAMFANNVMSTLGILVVGINVFRPGLEMTRELAALKIGGAVWAITALYENIVPLLKRGYEITSLEPFGFLAFMGCLVYIVAYRFFKNEKDLITIARELETARQIQSFILPRMSLKSAMKFA